MIRISGIHRTADKYIVFKRDELFDLLEDLGVSTEILTRVRGVELKDGVVIRRQDKFASPCLLTYAVMISMVAENHPDPDIQEELTVIADYFHGQGVLAGEEGAKLPTL
jgi:hypothetical protein